MSAAASSHCSLCPLANPGFAVNPKSFNEPGMAMVVTQMRRLELSRRTVRSQLFALA
jgi:hypothetical protein